MEINLIFLSKVDNDNKPVALNHQHHRPIKTPKRSLNLPKGRKPLGMLILFTLLHSLCFGQTVVPQRIDPDSLENYTRQIIEKYDIPGIQVALVSGNQILNVAAVGKKKIGGDSLSIHSKMHLGSCGKAMTGYLAGILVAKKQIGWRCTISDIFPELAVGIDPKLQSTTFKALLSHQSLLPPFTTGEEWEQLKRFTTAAPEDRRYQFAKWILSKGVVPFDSANKAEGYRYSNAGYSIAAAMMEKVIGKPWEQLIKEEVFVPLGIDVMFGWPANGNPNASFGHMVDEDTGDLVPHDPNGDFPYEIDPILAPSGDMSMSIVDYCKFIQLNLRGLNGHGQVYKKRFYRFLHYTNLPRSNYSIGWGAAKKFKDFLSTHSGSADTYYCTVLLLRKHNIAIMVIANAATDQATKGMKKIRNYLLSPYL